MGSICIFLSISWSTFYGFNEYASLFTTKNSQISRSLVLSVKYKRISTDLPVCSTAPAQRGGRWCGLESRWVPGSRPHAPQPACQWWCLPSPPGAPCARARSELSPSGAECLGDHAHLMGWNWEEIFISIQEHFVKKLYFWDVWLIFGLLYAYVKLYQETFFSSFCCCWGIWMARTYMHVASHGSTPSHTTVCNLQEWSCTLMEVEKKQLTFNLYFRDV